MTAENDCGRQEGTQSQFLSPALFPYRSRSQWSLQEMGKASTHSQQVFFTHLFFLTTVGGLVPKKLAVETGAGDIPNRVNCVGLAK